MTTAVAQRIAEISGTCLAPGVSKNGRLYTAEMIRDAVKRMQARLADENDKPLTMLSHHAAGDDSLRICGRLTEVDYQADGSATFKADIADNDAGRTIAALTTTDKPYLSNVSIRGWWLGEVRKVVVNGVEVETADGIEINGVDFTKDPGVGRARITAARLTETTEADGRPLITESLEGILVTETAPTPVFADKGYLGAGKTAFPIGDSTQVRSSWVTAQGSALEAYTQNQAKRIKGRIREAGKKLGLDLVAESTAVTAAVTEALEEAYASMNIDNGDAEVRVAGWTRDGADLPAIGRRIAAAAMAAMTALDPDQDGDIDLEDDDEVCAGCGASLPDNAAYCPGCGAVISLPTGETLKKKEPTVSETTKTPEQVEAEATATAKAAEETAAAEAAKKAEEGAPKAVLTEAELDQIVEKLAAKLKPATEETAPKATEPTEAEAIQAKIDEAVKAGVAAATTELRNELGKTVGALGRKGLTVPTTESTDGAKPLHEMSDEEFDRHKASTWAATGNIAGA